MGAAAVVVVVSGDLAVDVAVPSVDPALSEYEGMGHWDGSGNGDENYAGFEYDPY